MRKVFVFTKKPKIISVSSVVGKKEKDGPLGSLFDFSYADTKASQKTWEKAESEFVKKAFEIALSKASLKNDDVDTVFCGDLINQCTVSTYGLIDRQIPYFGIYGACSTFAEGLILSGNAVESGFSEISASATSSHFCTAERQYRFPIEYGCQRTPTSQNTVTAAGAVIISSKHESNIYLNEALCGIPIQKGITDINNMGAAMAPAAADTIIRYFKLSGNNPRNFDIIATGDLGEEGHSILLEILSREGVEIGSNFTDCGKLIYDIKKQDMHAGGSGCGCSAAVTNAYFYKLLIENKIKDLLIIGTGALLSPLSSLQGMETPGIAHLIRITRET
ncbi:MAG: stage V sporulation protein AD [Oscillospiraceae bacterium]|nr:stage V sporulation protein AD [Oscillospiraceae bacterium]